MRAIRITLDAALLAHVDGAARRLGLTRSAFTRRALVETLDRLRQGELEERHRAGYRRKPVRRGEFDHGRLE